MNLADHCKAIFMYDCLRAHDMLAVKGLAEAAEILLRDHQIEDRLCCLEDCSSVDRVTFKKIKLTNVSLCPLRIDRE